MNKPVVALFSDSNSLSLYLVENLLSKNCEVIVFAPDKKDWIYKTGHIAEGVGLKIVEEKDFVPDPAVNYAVFVLGFLGEENPFEKFNNFYSRGAFKNVKSVAIFPAELFNSDLNSRIPLNNNLSVIYTRDLLSPRVDFNGNLRANRIIMEVVGKRSLTAGIGEVFYPLFTPSAAKLISKWIFSFGPFGKEIFILGTEVSASALWKELNIILPDTKLFNNKGIDVKNIPRGFSKEIIETNLNFLLRETLKGIIRRTRLPEPQKKVKKEMPAYAKTAIAVLVAIFITPILSVFISALLLYSSYKVYLSGRPDITKTLLYIVRPVSQVGKGESDILKYIPLLGNIYKETGFFLYLGREAANLGINTIPVLETAKEFVSKILGNEIYDPASLSKDLGASFEYIYQKISLVQLEMESNATDKVVVAQKALDMIDFEKVKKFVFSAAKISEELPNLLGKEGRKTYLLLFQNNTELRPTGGFIGSFALVTLEGGRMTDFSVSDVYSADGQLKGHIEPPRPIRDYLNEANWFLRDSNWDPDFPTSAKRAEWFIDKEIDRQVEGVIGIDLNPVKDMLAYTGPIYLADYQMDISADNLYEKTQAEVQEDFFPGTHKKASFLTALSRNLVMLLGGLDSAQKAGILKTIFENFEERHIQTYLHNENVQNLISGLGWSGEIGKKDCGEGCFADFVGLVEANVGVNKANYFVTRDMNLEVNTSGGEIKRNLNIVFKNSANPNLGPAAKYKSYVRVFVPSDADVQQGAFDVSEDRGLKEVGFLIEVLAGEEKEVNISWSSAAGPGKYAIYVRKQAGTQSTDKLSVAIDGLVVYNSNLTKDTWIQKP